jgi:hypothetical protein
MISKTPVTYAKLTAKSMEQRALVSNIQHRELRNTEQQIIDSLITEQRVLD